MKILIQRVALAEVRVGELVVGKIGAGALVFIGVSPGDSEAHSSWLANKLLNLRMFEDEEGKMNKSLLECKGEILVVSQFTLYGDCTAGRRPSFTRAAGPEIAKRLYEHFAQQLRQSGAFVQTGEFGAKMEVSLVNDGPVTLQIEKEGLF